MYFHRSGRVAILTITLAAIALCAAGQTPSTAVPKVLAKYLLPAPPSAGSDEQKAEIEEILAIQSTRTHSPNQAVPLPRDPEPRRVQGHHARLVQPQRPAQAEEVVSGDVQRFGGGCRRRQELLQTTATLSRGRANPAPGPSRQRIAYPSGHATRGMLYATIL